MLIFSNIYYLVLRVSQKQGIHAKYSLVANFSIPPLLYFALGTVRGLKFNISLGQFLIIAFAALFLSYIGSYVSYIAMQKAPNGGYAMVIQKSYGIYTSIAAIFLFGSTLSWYKFLAIIFVLINSAVIMGVFDKKSIDKDSKSWIYLSLVSFFCFGTLRLAGKWFIGTYGTDQLVYQFWLLTFVAAISWLDLVKNYRKVTIRWNRNVIFVLAGTGIFVSAFYYFLLSAEISAPNIGYVGAINTASNAIFTVLAAKLINDHLSFTKFLAVLGVTVGIIVLIL